MKAIILTRMTNKELAEYILKQLTVKERQELIGFSLPNVEDLCFDAFSTGRNLVDYKYKDWKKDKL